MKPLLLSMRILLLLVSVEFNVSCFIKYLYSFKRQLKCKPGIVMESLFDGNSLKRIV